VEREKPWLYELVEMSRWWETYATSKADTVAKRSEVMRVKE
jgi:hypothetical protein